MKTIKNIFKSKITYAVLACLLLVGIFAGLTTLASNDPIVTIESKNINHAESARLVYRVKIANVTEQELINNAGALKMHFWTTEPAAPNAAPEYTVVGVTDGEDATGAYVLFESYDIAPKAMTNSVYCVAEYNGVYSDVCRYSVFEYLCEASMTANADQKALYSAMSDYIKYAQMYLGVDGDEFPSPDELGYIKNTNCYILVNGEKVYDGVVPLGYYEIYADFEYARFVNYKGSICEYTGMENKWGVNLTKSSKTNGYTAYDAAKITVNPVESAEFIRVNYSIVDSSPAYTVKEAYAASGFSTVICSSKLHTNDHYILLPATIEGKAFSHWAAADNREVVVSTSAVLNIDSYVKSALVVGGATEISIPVVPVFVDESVAKTNNLDSTGLYKNGALENKVSVTTHYNEAGDKVLGFTADKYAAGSGTGTAQQMGSVVEGTTTDLKRIEFGYTVKIESSVGNYEKPVLGDFFGTDVSYDCHYQNYLYMGDGLLLSFGFFPGHDDNKNVTADVSKGYFISIGDNIGNVKNQLKLNGNGSYMKYGVDNNVKFVIELKAVDGGYAIANTLIYVNDVFAGAACIRTSNGKTDRVFYDTFAYNTKVLLSVSTPMRPKSILTVMNPVFAEFN